MKKIFIIFVLLSLIFCNGEFSIYGIKFGINKKELIEKTKKLKMINASSESFNYLNFSNPDKKENFYIYFYKDKLYKIIRFLWKPDSRHNGYNKDIIDFKLTEKYGNYIDNQIEYNSYTQKYSILKIYKTENIKIDVYYTAEYDTSDIKRYYGYRLEYRDIKLNDMVEKEKEAERLKKEKKKEDKLNDIDL